MRDLTDHRFIYLKAALLLLLGLFSAINILLFCPSLQFAFLLGITVWAFARLYYFAFYVIEHYLDPTFRYAGLLSVTRYLVQRFRSGQKDLS